MIYTITVSSLKNHFICWDHKAFQVKIVCIYILLWNFFTLCLADGAVDSLSCPEGRVLYDCTVARGGFLLPSVMSCWFSTGWGGMVLGEIDTWMRNLNPLSMMPQKSGFKSLPRRTLLTARLWFDWEKTQDLIYSWHQEYHKSDSR